MRNGNYRRVRRSIIGVLVLTTLSGCFENITSDFPAELVPLEENQASWPEPDEGDPYPVGLEMIDAPTEDYHLVHARGYLRADLEAVYEAARLPETTVHLGEVDDWEVSYAADGAEECEDLPAEFAHCHRIENTVDDVITVKYHVVWRFGVTEGSSDAPREVLGLWKKTWGSDVIELLEGSVLLRRGEDETVTEVELIEHLDAWSGSREHARDFLKGYYRQMRTALELD